MAEKVLDTLSNNKLLVALLVAMLGWVGMTTNRVAAVEREQAVSKSVDVAHEKQLDRIEGTVAKIWEKVSEEK